MALNDLLDNGQAQPDAAFIHHLGGEERVIKLIHIFRRDAHTVVGDVEPHETLAAPGSFSGNPDFDTTLFIDRLHRVKHQVDYDLLELAHITEDLGNGDPVVLFNADVLDQKLVLDQR